MSRKPNVARSAAIEAGKVPEPGELTTEDRNWVAHQMGIANPGCEQMRTVQ